MSFRDSSKIEELLELYEEEDLLWNTSHEHYYRKDKRRQALNRISAMLGLPASVINKKITNLRTYYCKEINKVKRSRMKKTGHYVSKWEHFKTIDRFLYPFILGRKQFDLSDEDESRDVEETEVDFGGSECQVLKQEEMDGETEQETSTSGSRKRKIPEEDQSRDQTEKPQSNVSDDVCPSRVCQKQKEDSERRDVVSRFGKTNPSVSGHSRHTASTGSTEDGEDVFGKHVANELRLIPEFRTRQLVKLKIQNILFEAQCGCQSTETHVSLVEQEQRRASLDDSDLEEDSQNMTENNHQISE